MIFSSSDILTQQQLKRLSEHKYSSYGSTLLDPFMQRFWAYFVTKLPLRLAPNLMTVIGLLVNAFTTLILVCYSPDARQPVPPWALLLFAFGLFIYQTLDACDGKQARRTNSSSPLGELFDHGCDSLSTVTNFFFFFKKVFVAIATCIAVQLGHYPGWMFYQCIAASAVFYTAHWQTYVSATLRFGKFDVTEAQFTIMLINVISAIFGTEFWQIKVPYLNMDLSLAISYLVFAGIIITIYQYIVVIFTGGVGKNGSTVAIFGLNCEMKIIPVIIASVTHLVMTMKNFNVILSGGVGKNGSTVAGTSVLSPFIPIAVVVIPAFIIYQKSPTNLYENHPCLYLITFGFVIAKVTNKLVIAHMTKSEMEYLDSVLIGPAMLFLNQYFNTFLNEYFVLWVALVYTITDILHYGVIVCSQISGYLKISIFTINPYSSSLSPTSAVKNEKSKNISNGRDKRYFLRQGRQQH
ncbi:cholinephosphotransferase 1-like isoform X2 [Dinothrombium tinctorium]|uniref:diacylglycerol cholinephosphotransferase n=1 Tax=Dinothrombium tinctorium TaxID=1965070 RepID=A0A3S3PLT7_9ACAR|nr:cholinephosphotransferase 1-like isoform X2 [Dinothrombium tinctorium]